MKDWGHLCIYDTGHGGKWKSWDRPQADSGLKAWALSPGAPGSRGPLGKSYTIKA